MSGLIEAAAIQLAGGAVRPAVYLYVEASTGPLRLSTGFGDRRIAPDAVDIEGGVYRGMGGIIGLPTLNQLINGIAQRVEFSLSAVTDEILQLADAEAETVRGAPTFLGFTAYDDDWQPYFAPYWLAELRTDTVKLDMRATTQTLTLSAGTVHTDRKRPRMSFFTGPDQRRRSPTDAFCDRVAGYSANTTVRWPA